MKKLIIICLGILLSISSLYAQRKFHRHTPKKIKRVNSFFLEGGGNGIYGSVNYDKVINYNAFALSLRIGAGVYPSDTQNDNNIYPIIPLEINTLWGRKNHFIEGGLGVSTLFLYPINSQENFRYLFLGFARIGYRLQKDNGMFLRIAFTPVLFDLAANETSDAVRGFQFVPWAGISIGESF
ncbi:hypothetical protein BKI52_20690 [marine bacterium AO1-C]|nr:hypothetical protein BKI52_20690 [marine bacterium AO1-C]